MDNSFILKVSKVQAFCYSYDFKFILNELLKINSKYIENISIFYSGVIENELFCNEDLILDFENKYTDKIDSLVKYDFIENTIYFKCIASLLKMYTKGITEIPDYDELSGKWRLEDEVIKNNRIINKCKDLLYYYDTLFKLHQSKLPFKIIDKEIEFIDDPNPKLDWYIELNENGIKTVKNDIETTKTKQRNPIKWNGNINDLAYLFWSLSKAGVLNIDSFGIDLSAMFVDSENKEILNTMFNKYSSEFDKSKYPANAKEIDTLVNILKSNIKK